MIPWESTTKRFQDYPEIQKQNYILNKQDCVKVQLKRFHQNVNTIAGISSSDRLKSQKNILNKQYNVKVLLKRFHLNCNTGFVHDFFHDLKFSCHFYKFLKLLCFRVSLTLNSSTDTNFGVHLNVPFALFNHSSLSYIDLVFSSAVTDLLNKT